MSLPVDPRLAVDLDPRKRPGVPMERPLHPEHGSMLPVPLQQSPVKVFRHGRPKSMTPVYGTALPPAGLSGKVRALAYSYPDHWARHWELLFLADRVDLWEHRARRVLPFVAPFALLAAGFRFGSWLRAR